MAFNGVFPAGAVKPSPYGLFSVAEVAEKGPRDSHWGQGFSAMSEACAFDANIVDICGGIDSVPVYVNSGERFKEVRPFGIIVFDKCLSVGFDAEDRRARAVRQLELVTQKAVETELWAGPYRSAWNNTQSEPDNLAFLAGADTEVVESTAVSPKIGLALLEQAVANCGPGIESVIHMSPLVSSALEDGFSAVKDEEFDKTRLRTAAGNLVSVGAGYDGRGPGEGAPTDKFVHWMYATGPVHVVLGSEELITVDATQALDTRTNEMTYAAERPAAVYTDGCCQLAVKIDIRL